MIARAQLILYNLAMNNKNETVAVGSRYEELLAEYLLDSQEKKDVILSFLNQFPKLPGEPREAFVAIQNYLINNGFEYDNQTFLLEDVIKQKRGNCLGLCVLFGTILKAQGFDVKYEIAVNPKDAHYRNDLEQFNKLIHGDMFPYDNLPDLPNEKAEMPQGWFTPLEHPILILGNKHYETTSLLMSEEASVEHDYDSESRRTITDANLLGALFSSKAKMLLRAPGVTNYEPLVDLVQKGLKLWPEDRQSLLMLRDLAVHNFDDRLKEESENRFMEIGGDDSLYNFSLYEITGDKMLLDRSLEQYPAYVDAYLVKNIKLPLKTEEEKREARFNFTVGAVCVANSTELDLGLFYLRNIEIISAAFGEEYAVDLLYDLELDKKWPVKYYLSLFQIRKEISDLETAIEKGALEESTPLESLHICSTVFNHKSVVNQSVLDRCRKELEKLKSKHSNSMLFKTELERLQI